MKNLTLQPTTDIKYQGQTPLHNLHLLKGLGALMVVAIHAPGMFPAWIEGITRFGVILFLMTTGYFLPTETGILDSDKIKRTIRKIFLIDVGIQTAYIIFRLIQCILHPDMFASSFLSLHGWIDFLLTGRYYGYQLWYLHAVILALSALYILVRLRMERIIYYLAPLGVAMNLVIGSYLFLYSDADLSPFASRNFLTVCLPAIAAGIWLRRVERKLPSARFLATVLTVISALALAESMIICDIKSTGDVMLFSFPGAIAAFSLALKHPQVAETNPIVTFGREHSMNMYLWHVMVIFTAQEVCAVYDAWGDFWFWLFPFTVVVTLVWSIVLKRISQARARTLSGVWNNNR